jgi:hypothetical protein
MATGQHGVVALSWLVDAEVGENIASAGRGDRERGTT